MGFSPFGRAEARPSELRFRLGRSRAIQLPFCRAGFYTPPTNFFRRGVKPRPTLSQFSFVGQGFIPCRRNFLSARCETAPYIEPIFLCRAGFYTPPTFWRCEFICLHGVKPCPTRLDEPTSNERQPRILVRPVVNPCLSRDVNRQQAAVFVVPRKIVKVANKQVTSERK